MPKAHVLVVDDNADLRDILALILSHAGYTTSQAGDGVEAVETARREHPDVIVMDVYMPRMNGVRATELIKEDASLSRIPVIAQSANLVHADNHASLFFRVLNKPCDPDVLLECIEQAVRG
jgi:CheY-like chemotaxis protein